MAPKVEFQQKVITGLVQTDCELQAIINGIPFPDVKWFGEDKLIEANEHIQCEREENIFKLKFINVTLETTGVFKCLAENSVGKAEAKATLQVHGNSLCFSVFAFIN